MKRRAALPLLCIVSCWPAAAGAPRQTTPYIGWSDAELVRAFPELSNLEFERDSTRLAAVLKSAGDVLEPMLRDLVECAGVEEVHEMRLRAHTHLDEDRRERFQYAMREQDDRGESPIVESRTRAGAPVEADPKYPLMSGFMWWLQHLLPAFQPQSRFKYLGREPGQNGAIVIAFAQSTETAQLVLRLGSGARGKAFLQGLIWIDPATSSVLRVHASLLPRPADAEPQDLITDIRYAAVRFPSQDATVLLPARVTVDVRFRILETYTVHRFSDWRLTGDDAGDSDNRGISAGGAASEPDARELEIGAVKLMADKKWADAAKNLHQAMGIDSAIPDGHYYLGVALSNTGDPAAAEAELQQAVKDDAGFAPAWSSLGVLQVERGEFSAATTSLREALRLNDKDAAAHYSLGVAFEKKGDRAAALAEFQEAHKLEPFNDAFEAASQRVADAAKAPLPAEGENPIQVNVRQVLVPVVVLDGQGYYVPGLTKDDFLVYEDGVQQEISGFNVEHSNNPAQAINAGRMPQEAAGQPGPKREAETSPPGDWLICIDTLHGSFANFASARQALQTLFREERPGASEYALLALGRTMKVIQNNTRDPAALLAAIGSSSFQGAILDSEKGNGAGDMTDFRRLLSDAVNACDAGSPTCPSLKAQLPPAADRIANEGRLMNIVFLDQLRSLAAQLAGAPGRHTLVLISDGFTLAPGREPFRLLEAAFPEFRFAGLRSLERSQKEFDAVVRAAQRDNVSVYTIDSRGLYVSDFYDAGNTGGPSRLLPDFQRTRDDAARDAGQSLAELAAATGGVFFQNNNDLLTGLRRAIADGRDYYMLAYTPKNPAQDGHFRRITVQVKHRNTRILAKKGYWAGAP
ncbi:MAG TPA: VWA domain-containing protein [Bryobacteraceae bacterium]|nr:VWA domain-containing protein [Bryobacteraceae bacterium]